MDIEHGHLALYLGYTLHIQGFHTILGLVKRGSQPMVHVSKKSMQRVEADATGPPPSPALLPLESSTYCLLPLPLPTP